MPDVGGRPLRYFLTLELLDAARPMTVAELVDALEAAGITTLARPSKAVSDALRWEIRRGRVARLERSHYVVRPIAESTVRYLRRMLAMWLERAEIYGRIGDRPPLTGDPRTARWPVSLQP